MARAVKGRTAKKKRKNAPRFSTPREHLIAKAKEHFRGRLNEVDHPTVTTFYLDEVKKGRGFFWMYKRLTNKGYRVQFQKVTKALNMVGKKKGYGGYPLKYLRNSNEINSFMTILAYTATHFTERFTTRKAKQKDAGNLKPYMRR